jgi:putative hydrolase of the HAD superfamily
VTAVFFDLDNTLVDHSGAEHAASTLFYEVIADRTTASSLEEFVHLWTRAQDRHFDRYVAGEISFQEQRRERISEVLGTKHSEADADDLFSIYLGHYEDSWRAYPDVLPCLESLCADHVTVITNGDAAQQRKKLRRTGLADRFDEVITSADFGCSKPDPRIFLYACERAAINPSDAIHIGDSLTVDYRGACAAGLRGVLLVREGSTMPADPSITTVRGLNELPSLVGG